MCLFVVVVIFSALLQRGCAMIWKIHQQTLSYAIHLRNLVLCAYCVQCFLSLYSTHMTFYHVTHSINMLSTRSLHEMNVCIANIMQLTYAKKKAEKQPETTSNTNIQTKFRQVNSF